MNKTKLILEAFKRGEKLTQLEATPRFGTTRLAAIVAALKEKGYSFNAPIIKVNDRHGNTCHVAQYSLKAGPGIKATAPDVTRTQQTQPAQGTLWTETHLRRA